MAIYDRCLITLVGIFFMLFSAFVQGSVTQQNIMVLHSYDPGYEWTKEFQEGISDAFDSANQTVKLSIEYMDSKRLVEPEYYEFFKEYLTVKYQSYHLDGILVTDDRALRFLNQLDMPNFRNLPTVAAGINDLEASLSMTTDKGIILSERDYISENLALIVKLRPNIQTLYYLADGSVSSVLIREQVLNELVQFPRLKLAEIGSLTLEEAKTFLSDISPDDAVILTHFNTELANDVYHGYTKTALEVSKASAAPVFVFWGFYLKGDVLGGYVNRSYALGVQMVDILGKKLNRSIQVSLDPEKDKPAVFLYSAIKRHQIQESLLPENSLILGKPISFLERNYQILIVFSGVVLFLIAIILLLSYALKRKRELIQKDKKIVALQAQTLNVQKKLINVLGDSIETRSGETGNHVKRVATLSSHLAKLAGLSARECEIIEIISPMHDVGKIGIPEVILNKPGKLTSEEWTLMQTHAKLGHNLLHTGEGDIMNLAAVIAHEHHEKWDGTGYPEGKAGEEIHIFARITTIADVYDALRSKRCYKEAWPVEDVVAYLKDNRGTHFDPRLIDLFLGNLKDFMSIREKYADT